MEIVDVQEQAGCAVPSSRPRGWREVGLATAAILLIALAQSAAAQIIDVDDPEIKKGESEIKSLNTANGRYKAGAAGNPRSSHEQSAGYSPLDYFKISAHVDFENLAAEDFRLEHAAIKTFFELMRAGEKGGIGLGWHTALQAAIHQDATNSVVFGPMLKLAHERAVLLVNSYVEKTFGQNREPGMALSYGWQGKLEIREGFSIGIEGVGKIEELGNSPPWSEQDHRIGPALFFEWPAGKDRTMLLDVAVFAGLTEATPTTSLKLNLGAKF